MYWFPQSELERLPAGVRYQGQAFLEVLESRGFVVHEIPRAFMFNPPSPTEEGVISLDVLSRYTVVVRANEYPRGGYSQAEYDAYREFVRDGGGLLLVSDFARAGQFDGLARVFGFDVRGMTRGDKYVRSFESHPVTDGVLEIFMDVSGGIVSAPAEAEILGRYSDATYLDLNEDQVQQPDELVAPAALATLQFGRGRIVLITDMSILLVKQPLLDNIVQWLME